MFCRKSSTIIMRHVLWQDDGEFDEAAYNLFGVVLIPRCLIDQFFFAFLRNRVDIGGGIVQKMLDDLLRTFIVALHEVTATGITIHLDGTIVLVEDFTILGANGNSQIHAFEIIRVTHNV